MELQSHRHGGRLPRVVLRETSPRPPPPLPDAIYGAVARPFDAFGAEATTLNGRSNAAGKEEPLPVDPPVLLLFSLLPPPISATIIIPHWHR